MIHSSLPTVTIAICAHNESANIGPLMESILKQKERGYILEKILVISDGSTDKTAEIVRSFNSPKIDLKDYPERQGKSHHLNEIYATVTSNFIVQPDADVILDHEYVVAEIIAPLIANERVGITGGNAQPMTPETFIERAIACTYEAYTLMRLSYKDGNNLYSATGRLIAMRKAAYSGIKVPDTTISNDHFVYFHALNAGFEYRYAHKAMVRFRLPQTLKDHLNQETRFSAAEFFMKRYYPAKLVDEEYAIPDGLFGRMVLKQTLKHPIYCSVMFLLNSYCKLKALSARKRTSALWDIVYSTKTLVNTKR